jgi:hypothetical protein
VAQSLPVHTDTPTSVLAAVIWLGGVIVGGMLFAIRALWKDNQLKQQRIDTLHAEHIEIIQKLLREALTVTIDSTDRVRESAETIEAAMVIIHQTTGQRFTADQLQELLTYMRELRDLKKVGA